MDRKEAAALLARLHDAQNRFYGGGDDSALRELLAPDVTWTVPGRNAIAGAYRGRRGGARLLHPAPGPGRFDVPAAPRARRACGPAGLR